jgi:hypothetical protein
VGRLGNALYFQGVAVATSEIQNVLRHSSAENVADWAERTAEIRAIVPFPLRFVHQRPGAVLHRATEELEDNLRLG